MKLGGALLVVLAALTACSASSGPTGLGPAEQGAEASAAIAAAKSCVQTTGSLTSNGFTVDVDKGTARRDPNDAARWIVAFPPGPYLGRLPPPGPGEPLLLAVAPTKGSECTVVPKAPTAR